MDLYALMAEESAILDAASSFLAGHRTDPAAGKKCDDFATEGQHCHRTAGRRCVDRNHGDRRARRGVRGSGPGPTLSVGIGPDRRHMQLCGGIADDRYVVSSAALRRLSGGLDLDAVHRRVLHGRRGWVDDEKWCFTTIAGYPRV